jgi:pyruvate carboxylase
MFKRVLIANRGEIAIRIARAASLLGMETVSIYPPADALSLHTRVSTQSVALGASSDPVRAYLDVDAVIGAAKSTHCDCVHPGYGFLSENATFAERCNAAGLTFVGPDPETLSLFGDKTKARSLARSLGIPIVPGSAQSVASAQDCRDSRQDRLSRDAQGGRRRRWARHASGQKRNRNDRGAGALPERSVGGVRRRIGLS